MSCRTRVVRRTSRSVWARRAHWLAVAGDSYRLDKPRTRAEWQTWVDDSINLAYAKVADAEVRRELRGDRSSLVLLPVYDARMDRPVPPDEPVTALGRRRRALAQELHAQLTDPSVWTGPDRLGWAVLSVPLAKAPDAVAALRAAPLVARQHPSSVVITKGKRSGAVVLRVHGDTFSLVFTVVPSDGPVLVITDDLPDYAVRVDDDPDVHAVMRVMAMKDNMVQAMDLISRPVAGAQKIP